ncbi:putative membrane protein [Helicobacter pylori Hp H-43]|nr:putative membrane protein [Helicobacter pylori Hp H-43]
MLYSSVSFFISFIFSCFGLGVYCFIVLLFCSKFFACLFCLSFFYCF